MDPSLLLLLILLITPPVLLYMLVKKAVKDGLREYDAEKARANKEEAAP